MVTITHKTVYHAWVWIEEEIPPTRIPDKLGGKGAQGVLRRTNEKRAGQSANVAITRTRIARQNELGVKQREREERANLKKWQN